jgi:hypothetical protein
MTQYEELPINIGHTHTDEGIPQKLNLQMEEQQFHQQF